MALARRAELTFPWPGNGRRVGRVPLQDASSAPSIGDLRRAQPADATLSNLLEVLGAKLKLCSRLAVFEYEAGREGHAGSATAFRALADMERASFEAVVRSLKCYLDEAASAVGEADDDAASEGLP
jgi:hypothetical protein